MDPELLAGLVSNVHVFARVSPAHKLKIVQAFQQAYDKGWRQIWVLKIDGRLDALRGNPGFVALEQRILEDVSRARAEVRDLKVAAL